MPVTINGTTGIVNPDGSAATPSLAGSDTNTGVFFPAADTVAIATGGSERLRADSAGNVGIGVTPSAWVSNFKALQVGTGGTFYGDYNNTTSYFGNNAFFNGSAWKYVSSSYALYAYQDRSAGKHVWAVASSGTAGNNITWTEAMTLDSSGNLLVGRTNNPGSLSSSLYVTGAYSNTTPSGANVFVNTDGSFYRSTSSLKYKTDVRDYVRGLSDVAKLRPVFYKAKAGLNTEQEFAGFIAEEIEEAGLTEFVQYAENGTPDALSYGNMVALLTKAIQEQQAMIVALKAEVDALKGAQA